MEIQQSKLKTREFITHFIRKQDLEDDHDIFALGFVNSMFAMQLVLFIENEFGVAIDNEDLEIENFNTINAIAALIERKTASCVLN